MHSLSPQKRKVKKILQILKNLYPKTEKFLHFSNHFELLVAVILSAQTTDKKVNEVTARLFKKYKTLSDYTKANVAEFQKDIQQIGLYKTKAKNILQTAKIIKEKYQGKVPKTMEEMIELPGVGRKTANVVLGYAHKIVEGIAVDTHVTRLAQLYGLSDFSDPKKIEQDLMKILPKKEWFDFTNRMIAYGREYCPARNHEHKNCPLAPFSESLQERKKPVG